MVEQVLSWDQWLKYLAWAVIYIAAPTILFIGFRQIWKERGQWRNIWED